MKLVALDIRRLPGIDAPFGLASEIGARVTVIQGPNGSGKSSLCRAIRALLWPKIEPSTTVDLTALFSHGESEFRVERHGSHVTWTSVGSSTRAPDLPPEHVASCFTISGDDLLGEDAERAPRTTAKFARKDGRFAAEVARELSGGFDLRALRSAIAPAARVGNTEERALRDAQNALGGVTRAHASLHAEAQELAVLEAKERDTKRAAARVKQLETEHERARARETVRVLTAQLAAFEPGMDRLRGDELDELRERRRRLAQERETLRKADEAIAEARAAIAATSLRGEGPTNAVIAAQKQRVHELVQLESEHRRLSSDEWASRAKREEQRKRLDPASDSGAEPRFERAQLAALEVHVRRADELTKRRSELNTQIGEVETSPAQERDLETLDAALRCLEQWLRTPADVPSASKLDPRHWALLALAVGASIALALTVHVAWLALVAVAVLCAITLRRATPRSARSARSACETEFTALRVPPPQSWSEAAVDARRQELRQERTALALAQERRAHKERLKAKRRELEDEEREHAAERERLRAALGIDAVENDLSLALIAANVIAFRAASDETTACVARRGENEDRRRELGRAIARFLEPFGSVAGDDAAALGCALDELQRRSDSARQAVANLQRAEAQRRDAERRCNELEGSITKVLEVVSTELDGEIALARRIERLDEWRALARRLESERANESSLAEKLRTGASPGEADPGERTEEEIVTALEAAKALAAERDDLVRRIQDIRTRVEQVRGAHALAEALERVSAARDALAARREDAIADAVLDGLLAQIEDEERQTAQSPVFQRAKSWFAKFTHHAYELQLGASEAGNEPTFQALDTAAREVRSLDELSTGTRAQLLLAARVAFAIEAEHGAKLPLFLDEALLAADPSRFEAVARALALLAREEERQVIYLTSDPMDTQRWRSIGEDVAVVDLARVRKLAAANERPLIPLLELARPSIEGLAPSEIARVLGVAAPDPWQAPDAVHVYHVVGTDFALLRTLLDQHVETLGSVRSLARSPTSARRVADTDLRRVIAWGEVYAAFVHSWRIGRGRPLTRDVLEAAGMSDKYLAPVGEIAAELAWDGKELVRALRTRADARLKNMRETSVQRVEDYFAVHGYYDARDVLAEHAIVERAIDAASGDLLPADVAVRVKSWCRALEPQPARTRTIGTLT